MTGLLKLPADVLVVSRNLLHMVDGNPRTIWSHKVESQPTEIQIALDSKYKVNERCFKYAKFI